MTTTQHIITIAMVVLGTVITRFLPFIVFPAGKEAPKYIQYLGKALPGAIFGMLVVFSLKGLDLTAAPFGAPQLISLALVIGMHLWKKNMLLSIAGGTICCMVLTQLVF